MTQLSATQAIGPAWERTKQTVARPFKFGRAFKVCLVAFLAQIVGVGISIHQRSNGAAMPGNMNARTAHFFQMMTGASVLLWAIFFLIGIVIFYVGCRMQFVVFDFIVTRNTTVAPSWQRHAHHTFRWIAIRLIPTLFILLLSAFSAFVLAKRLNHSGHPHGFIVFILSAFGLFIFFAYVVITALLRDFVLPLIALEDLSIADCLTRFSFFLSNFTGDVFLYLLIRVLLALAIWIITVIGFIIAALIACIPIFIIAAVVGAGKGSSGALLVGLIAIIGVFIAGIIAFFVAILATGTVQVFFTALGLFFYGSRYPLLGNLLDPPPAIVDPPAPPPAFDPAPTPI